MASGTGGFTRHLSLISVIFRALTSAEIVEIYPGKIQNKDDKRIFIMNTLFNLPESFLTAALINYFDDNVEYEGTTEGWKKHNASLSFTELFQASRERDSGV